MAQSKFTKAVVLRIKGDEADAAAVKIERKAKSAFNSQISALEARKVDLEQKKEDADLALENAVYTDKPIENGEYYIQNIKAARTALDRVEEEVEAVIDSIEFYQALRDEMFETA